jgi:hypothetical protein
LYELKIHENLAATHVIIENHGLGKLCIAKILDFVLTLSKVEKTNMAVAKSAIGRQFRLEFSGHRHERKGTRFLTEIRAGLATFFAMAYIISVNASVVAGKFSALF